MNFTQSELFLVKCSVVVQCQRKADILVLFFVDHTEVVYEKGKSRVRLSKPIIRNRKAYLGCEENSVFWLDVSISFVNQLPSALIHSIRNERVE